MRGGHVVTVDWVRAHEHLGQDHGRPARLHAILSSYCAPSALGLAYHGCTPEPRGANAVQPGSSPAWGSIFDRRQACRDGACHCMDAMCAYTIASNLLATTQHMQRKGRVPAVSQPASLAGPGTGTISTWREAMTRFSAAWASQPACQYVGWG